MLQPTALLSLVQSLDVVPSDLGTPGLTLSQIIHKPLLDVLVVESIVVPATIKTPLPLHFLHEHVPVQQCVH